MRYVGGDYDQFDDDDEEEVEDDDDQVDDDDEESSSSSSQSRVNPFGNSSSRPTSNLPGAGGRTSPVPSSSASSAARPPLGSSTPGSRPASPSSPTTSSGGTSPFGGSRPASSPTSPGASSGSSGAGFGSSRPAGSGSTFGSGSSGGSSGGSGGSSPFGGSRPASPSSPSSPGGSSGGGSSSTPNRPAGSGSTFGSGSSSGSSGSSGGSGGSSPFGGSRPAGSSSSPSSPSSSPAKPAGSSPSKPEDKKPGVLGGIAGRFGGGGGDKDKPATPKASSSGSSGGLLGGITGRFGGGTAKAGDKPATPKASSGAKPGGLLGGITGRFGGGAKADDKKPAPSSSSSSSSFGGTRSTGTNPAVGGAKPAASSTGGSSPFGRLGGNSSPGAAKPATTKASAGAKTGFGRFLPSFLSGGDASAKPAPKSRASKAPTLDDGAGISLDTKLDILGVALLLGSLALIFSRLSSTQGKLTQAINDFLIELAGWGSIAIPVAMLIIGVWLIARHFGENAPVIPRKRVIGIVITYIAVLTAMSYVDTFSFVGSRAVSNFQELSMQMGLSLNLFHTGGGRIGWEIYYFLVSNVTEAGAFFMILLMLIIGSMFTLDIGAAELAMIVISNVRSFQDTRQRRAQQRQAAAASLEQLTAQAAPPALSVSKEAAPALPAAPIAAALPAASEAAALPAGEPVRAERPIAINIGGKKEMGGFGAPELVPVERQSAAPAAKAPTPSPAGGIAGRFGSMIPGRKSPEPASLAATPAKAEAASDVSAKPSIATTAAAATAGAIAGGVGRLFNRGGKDDSTKPADKSVAPVTTSPSQPAAATINAAASTASSAAPVRSPMPPPSNVPAASTKQEPSPTRLGELMKPAAAPSSGGSSVSPSSPSRPAFGSGSATGGSNSASPMSPPARTFGSDAPKPFGTTSAATSSAAPAKPPVPAASPYKSPFSSSTKPEDDLDDMDDEIDDDVDEMDDSEELSKLPPATPKGLGEPMPRQQSSRFGATTFGSNRPADAQPGSTDRMGRLNEIRQGGTPITSPSSTKPDGQATDKPAAPVNQPAVASAAPINGNGSATPPASSPFGKPTTPPASTPSSAFGKPTAPPASTPSSAFGKPAVPTGDKTPQPAAAFWNDNKPAASAATPMSAAPAKAYEPEKSETPRPKAEPAAPSYGKPPDPAGVTINPGGRDGMASAALTTPPPPPAHTAAAAVPDATPIGRSPEIPLRQAGVGTTAPTNVPRKRKEWRMPSISQVLMPGSENDFDRGELLRRAKTIEETLLSFGAPGKVVEVNTGPVITQFGVEPDYLVTRSGKKNRVKVGAIAQLDKDLQLALGAKSIRIEAPVPGKGYVGIEVPNDQASLVSLRDVMESDQFKKLFNKSPLAIALGQSVDGTPISADLGSMPHLLIAGTTGSGKSVCVNAIITSLIAMNPPDKVKFIMVDPKRVELTGYNGIPHLVAPVVVELERIVGVLKWVTREMDERYKKFSLAGARNIEDYNKHLGAEAEQMPYIVVIIDELADLMMLAPDDTERVITRIAALARATGIHLVIATQRPSVDVVTGLIKANFPARIAFAVAGGVDSRVILDQPGAERLLGKGDMLYMSGDAPAALRLQGVYVSDQEIQNITRYWKSQITADDVAARPINALVVDNTVVEPSRSVIEGNERSQAQQAFWDNNKSDIGGAGSSGRNGDGEDASDDQEDVLYEEAVEMVRRLGKASVSLLQRRLRIGYTRSARLIDRMEEEGIIGPAVEGAKPREVLPLK